MAAGWLSTKSNEVSSLFGTFRTQMFAALALSVGAFFTIALLSSATPSALLSTSQRPASAVLTAGKDILSEVKTFGMTFEASLKRKQQAQELAKTESQGQTKDMAAARDKLAAQQQLYYQAVGQRLSDSSLMKRRQHALLRSSKSHSEARQAKIIAAATKAHIRVKAAEDMAEMKEYATMKVAKISHIARAKAANDIAEMKEQAGAKGSVATRAVKKVTNLEDCPECPETDAQECPECDTSEEVKKIDEEFDGDWREERELLAREKDIHDTMKREQEWAAAKRREALELEDRVRDERERLERENERFLRDFENSRAARENPELAERVQGNERKIRAETDRSARALPPSRASPQRGSSPLETPINQSSEPKSDGL